VKDKFNEQCLNVIGDAQFRLYVHNLLSYPVGCRHIWCTMQYYCIEWGGGGPEGGRLVLSYSSGHSCIWNLKKIWMNKE